MPLRPLAIMALLLLCACGGGRQSQPGGDGAARAAAQDTQPDGNPDGIYAPASACWSLQSEAAGQWVLREGEGWAATAAAAADGSRFYFKATGLGSYLLQDEQGQLLGVSDPLGELIGQAGDFVGNAGSIAAGLGALVEMVDGTRTPVGSVLRQTGLDLRDRARDLGDMPVQPALAALPAPTELAIWNLSRSETGAFWLTHQVTGLRLAATQSGPLALADIAMARGVDGFRLQAAGGCAEFPEAELNAQVLQAPKRLNADGSVFGWVDGHNHITGSEYLGGRVTYGYPFHPLGITQALGDCAQHHGPEGTLSPVSYVVATAPHDTTGWPRFADWPGSSELTHHQTYYLWLKRAFLAGQKLMVNHFVESQLLCSLHAAFNRNDCNPMASIRHQREQLLALQDYIDAQEGGPGEGWFRIVTHPTEAREVIANGQMAVVMGAEVSRLFDCGRTYDQPNCSITDIREQLAELKALGLRSLFPIHKEDNAFGGARQPVAGTHTEECAPLGEDQMDQPPPGLLDGLANTLLAESGAGGDTRWCNALELTPHGEFMIAEMMRQKLIIEIDHTGARTRDRILQIARDYGYPVVTAHSWTNEDALPRVWEVEGAFARYSCTADCFVSGVFDRYIPSAPPGAFLHLGIGTDANGLGPLPGVRPGADADPLQYPFTSYDGRVVFDRQVTGERVFDLNADGVAHYGLYADWVADVQHHGGEGRDTAMEMLFRSAEGYLRMWERVEGLR